jgi:hypothetical protein
MHILLHLVPAETKKVPWVLSSSKEQKAAMTDTLDASAVFNVF